MNIADVTLMRLMHSGFMLENTREARAYRPVAKRKKRVYKLPARHKLVGKKHER